MKESTDDSVTCGGGSTDPVRSVPVSALRIRGLDSRGTLVSTIAFHSTPEQRGLEPLCLRFSIYPRASTARTDVHRRGGRRQNQAALERHRPQEQAAGMLPHAELTRETTLTSVNGLAPC